MIYFIENDPEWRKVHFDLIELSFGKMWKELGFNLQSELSGYYCLSLAQQNLNRVKFILSEQAIKMFS